MSAVDEITIAFENLHKQYEKHLPKVDPARIGNLLNRQRENPSDDSTFLIEVFTKPGLNTEEVRRYIIEKTGMSPEIYDNGTHYVTNQKLNLRILKEISDSEDVIEITGTGEHTGRLGGYGPSHEHRENTDVGRATSGRGRPPE